LDHCGRLPLLAKRGFRGEIIATSATRRLARVVTLDAAHLQEEGGRIPGAQGRTAVYSDAIALLPGWQMTFLDAGHILGSASIFLHLNEAGRRCSGAFSGDLGNRGRPLLRDPVAPAGGDVLVMENTAGTRTGLRTVEE